MQTPMRSPTNSGHEGTEPTIAGAAGRAIEAGHRLLIRRIDLARLDVIRILNDALRGSVVLVAGTILMLVGWTSLSVAAVLALQPMTGSWVVGSAIVGAANVSVGILLAGAGMRIAQPEVGGETAE
jgi:hypothetical protein